MCSDRFSSLDEVLASVRVVIPAYNSSQTVGRVVKRIREFFPQLEVIVVDDGSTDETASVAEEAGAVIIRHERNRGKGEALQTGFKEALARSSPGKRCSAIITLDADYQHLPEEIPNLVRRWLETKADIVIGTRQRRGTGMPLVRIVTNLVSSGLVSLVAGTRIPDSQSGYRLITRNIAENIRTGCPGYGAESELLIKAGILRYKIESCPIATVYSFQKSYIHPVKQPLLFTGLILLGVLWSLTWIVKKATARNPHTSDQ